jgi:hypothetical protein
MKNSTARTPAGGLRPAPFYGMRTSLAVERTATGGMAQ